MIKHKIFEHFNQDFKAALDQLRKDEGGTDLMGIPHFIECIHAELDRTAFLLFELSDELEDYKASSEVHPIVLHSKAVQESEDKYQNRGIVVQELARAQARNEELNAMLLSLLSSLETSSHRVEDSGKAEEG